MKVLILSHIADPDGITPIILSKLIFDTDFILLNNYEVDEKVEELLKENKFSEYDYVFMTDLCISKKIANVIKDQQIDNFLIMDHHIGKIEMNEYPFIQVIDTFESGVKQSATSLFYQYLLKEHNHSILEKNNIQEFVDLVRSGDTWEWESTNNIKAKQLGDLFRIYGYEYYLNYYFDSLKKEEEFKFTDKELYLLEIENLRIQNFIKEREQEIVEAQIDNFLIGIVFAEQYRSELGHYLAAKHPQYDFIVLININHGISYRGLKDIDLSVIAQKYHGSGHFYASGSPIPKHLKEDILKLCFPNITVRG